jgi:hypothetical protein
MQPRFGDAIRRREEVNRTVTLIAGTSSSPSNRDPHSAYAGRSVMVIYSGVQKR